MYSPYTPHTPSLPIISSKGICFRFPQHVLSLHYASMASLADNHYKTHQGQRPPIMCSPYTNQIPQVSPTLFQNVPVSDFPNMCSHSSNQENTSVLPSIFDRPSFEPNLPSTIFETFTAEGQTRHSYVLVTYGMRRLSCHPQSSKNLRLKDRLATHMYWSHMECDVCPAFHNLGKIYG